MRCKIQITQISFPSEKVNERLNQQQVTRRLYLLFLGMFFVVDLLHAQSDVRLVVSDQVIVSGASHLPFWFWANKDGKIDPWTSFLNFTDVSADGTSVFGGTNGPRLSYGVSLVGGLENESYLQLNRLFSAIDYNGWKISAGMYYDDLILAGLSTTNGNLAQSRNYRPYPRIGLSTPDFKRLPFWQDRLRFKLAYDEGLLNDERYVTHTHLHHKALYFQIIPGLNWVIEVGLEHFVMWGGKSENERIGALPDDFKAYLRYITASQGDDVFPETDQLHIAGNQYGTYQLKFTRKMENYTASFYICHPFENFSGMNLRNYPDNLLGIHVHNPRSEALVSDILYEFTDTRQQSIVDSIYIWKDNEWQHIPHDPYFSHWVYRSGPTYYKMAMTSPLFAPVIVNEGISDGFGSNRLVSHHFGMKGMLTDGLYWKTLLTATRYLGTYSNPYVPEKNQFSGLLQLTHKNQKLPFDMQVSLAFDSGTLYENALGVQFGISKQW